jgi:hypothetical protein
MKGITKAFGVVMTLVMAYGSKPAATAPQPTAPAYDEATDMAGICPMGVPGTRVSAEDTQNGVAMTFTTTGDVAALRQRVHAMAARHERMMGGGGGMGPCRMMTPSTTRVEDVGRGARIVLAPRDPSQLSELRTHVNARAAQMASGRCPMMGHDGAS